MTLGHPYSSVARCIMNPDKTVDYFLGLNDSNYKLDGSPVDWALVESSGQNVMVQIPKFYACKKWIEETQSMFFGASATPKETTYISENDWVIHPAFFKDQNKAFDDPTSVAVEVPFRYVGAFPGWIDTNGKMRSLPGKHATLTGLSAHRAAAKAAGIGFCCFDFNAMYAIQMLFVTEYGHPDSQKVLGPGVGVGSWPSKVLTGTTLSSGNNTVKSVYAFNAADLNVCGTDMSYRGIEGLYGSDAKILEGVIISGGGCLIGNAYYNSSGTGYLNTGVVIPSYNGNGGYIRTINNDIPRGFLPKSRVSTLSGLMTTVQANAYPIPSSLTVIPTSAVNVAPGSSNGLFGLYEDYTGSSQLSSRLAF